MTVTETAAPPSRLAEYAAVNIYVRRSNKAKTADYSHWIK